MMTRAQFTGLPPAQRDTRTIEQIERSLSELQLTEDEKQIVRRTSTHLTCSVALMAGLQRTPQVLKGIVASIVHATEGK